MSAPLDKRGGGWPEPDRWQVILAALSLVVAIISRWW